MFKPWEQHKSQTFPSDSQILAEQKQEIRAFFNLLSSHPEAAVLKRICRENEKVQYLTAKMIEEQVDQNELESFSETHFALQAWIQQSESQLELMKQNWLGKFNFFDKLTKEDLMNSIREAHERKSSEVKKSKGTRKYLLNPLPKLEALEEGDLKRLLSELLK